MNVTPVHSNDAPNTHLALIGYRGSGKSTIGPIVATLRSVPAVDADEALEKAAGRPIHAIFSDSGEAYFRDLETATLRRLLGDPPSVLSLGGGVILREENRRLLQSCFTVWLTAPLEVLVARLTQDAKRAQRPSLTSLPHAEEVTRLLQEREPYYAACADFTIPTEQLSAEEAAKSILNAWRARDAAPSKR